MTKTEQFIKSKNLIGVKAHAYTESDSPNLWTLPQLLDEFEKFLSEVNKKERKHIDESGGGIPNIGLENT